MNSIHRHALPARLNTIQSYRALVALVILLSHAFIVALQNGFVELRFISLRTGGVDFFFTLSGFLIHHVYAPKGRGAMHARAFFRKRVVRIYPLLWTFTLLSLPFYFFGRSHFGGGHECDIDVIVKSLLLLPQRTEPVLGATWSLSHIVLFYLVFCFYLWRPKLARGLVGVWLAAWLVWSLMCLHDAQFEKGQSYVLAFLFSPFNVEFLLGASLSVFVKRTASLFPGAFLASGIMGFALAWSLFNGSTPALLVSLVYCGSSLLLILGGVEMDRRFPMKPPAWIETVSNASYAIIIVNLPIVVAWTKLVVHAHWLNPKSGFDGVLLLFSSALLATLGGIAAHRWIEPRVSKWLDEGIDALFSRKVFLGATE
ncbi:MAG: hypothetical protein C0487_12210 [Leptothrix sp. (in: Bacteria)]|nr:hypothetical protein [Leptothrix sp. (in: b-proteobacteria)]